MPAAKIDAVLHAIRQHQTQGRLAQAETLCLSALKARPRDFDLLQSLANVALQSGRTDLAVERLEAAIAVRPASVETRLNLGTALRQLGRFEEALCAYDAATDVKGADKALGAALWTSRGALLGELGRLELAVESFDHALSLNENFAQAWRMRGSALFDLGKLEPAVESLRRALSLRPDDAEAWNKLGDALCDLERTDDARDSFARALSLRPDHPDARNNLGYVLWRLGRPDEAAPHLERALSLRPHYPEAWNNLGNTYLELGRWNEAMACYDRAIASKPDHSDAYDNRGMCSLLLGDFRTGWTDYEHRKLKRAPAGNRTYPKPVWTGSDRRLGSTVLIHAEQGLGDTIQFCRYLPMLDALGLRVLFAPQLLLCALMRTLSPSVEIVDADDPALRFDYHSPLMSLPLAFGTRLETIPAAVPYLAADPDRIVRWRRRIGSGGLRIGVSWRGSRTLQGRDFSPDLLRPLAAAPGVRLIRLQNDDDAAFDAHPGFEIERLEGLDAGPDAFLDTAAVMETLDLVITCDTAIAHLAGALGRPTWVALKHVPDWRWLLDRTDSPWYPTMRLFRQTTRGDWGPMFEEMAEALRERLAAQAPASSLPPS